MLVNGWVVLEKCTRITELRRHEDEIVDRRLVGWLVVGWRRTHEGEEKKKFSDNFYN